MSFMDTLKDKLGMAKGKAGDMAEQHPEKVDSGIDRAANTADSKTGGKHTDKIDTGADKARDAMGNRGDQGGRDSGGSV
ncbi:antitoxin [Streptomyces sp. NBC_01198]|uniref:antitoxin n=1 Tax=Streptomyces sp. NBC_01198 TaxID=2903769 RepID=UPI002E1608CF|nr:antitoxin [Streptomyces sp. NBC_01198]